MDPATPEATTLHQNTEAEIVPLLRERWSPCCFSERPVTADELKSILEAGRWAPSSYNEQPWAFIVGRMGEDDDLHARILSCLVPANQEWAKRAPVLLLSFARTAFQKNNKPNRHHLHDIGAAAAHMTFQATSLGLFVHQMAGIDLDRIRETFDIPPTHEPATAIALGHLETAPSPEMADLVERDQAPDTRRPLRDSFFTGVWGTAHPVVQ